MTRITSMFLVALALGAALPAQQEQGDAVVDLRGLRQAFREDPEPVLALPLLETFVPDGSIAAEAEDPGLDGPIESLFELMAAAGVLDLDGEDALWLVDQGLVEMRAPADRLARAQTFLASVAAHYLRGAVYEVLVLDRKALAGVGSARLAPPELAALLAAHPPIGRSLGRVRLARRENQVLSRRTAVLGDYAAEVAEKAEIADPETRSVFEGRELSLFVAPRDDGRFFVDLALRSAQCRQPPRELSEPATGIGRLELPSCDTQLLRCSGDLAIGEGLVVGSNEDRGVVRLLRLVSVDPEIQLPDGIELMPVAHMIRSLGRAGLPVIPRAGLDSSRERESEDDPEPEAPLSYDRLHEVIHDRVLGIDEGGSEGRFMILGGDLWMVGDQDFRQRLRRELGRRIRQLEGSVQAEIRWGLLDADALRADAAPTALAELLDNRIVMATRLGDRALSLAGEEAIYLREKDVEIASDARIVTPALDGSFSGFAVALEPNLLPDDRLAVAAEIVFQARSGSIRQNASERPELGSLDRLAEQRVELRPRFVTARGEWQLVTVSPLPGSGATLVVVVRLR